MSSERTRLKGSGPESITEALADRTNTPIEEVQRIYATESAELERTSRIKSFVGVIATRRTRAILGRRVGGRS